MRSSMFAEPVPAEAEISGNLKIHTYEYSFAGGTKYLVKIWRGKASRPYAHYSFSSSERRAKYIDEQKQSDRASVEFKAKMKAVQAEEKAKGAQLFEVGTLLAYSWGYDQTNVDFYQVVEKKGMTVKIRPIAGRTKKNSEGFDCNRVMPVKDAFIGEEVITKRITGTSLSMDHGTASITHELESHYCSWYR